MAESTPGSGRLMAHARNPRGLPVERNDIGHRYWLAAMAVMAALAGMAFLAYNDSGGDDIVVQRPGPTVTLRLPAAPPIMSRTHAASAPPSPTVTPATATPSKTPHAPPSAPNKVLLSGEGAIDPHSRDYWAQSNLTLRVGRELRTLTATVRVARTERVEPTGAWLTLPRSDFQSSAETSGDAVIYRWTLRPGRTVRPGSYVLAAQYNQTAAHDPHKDTFTVHSTSQDGQSTTAKGHF